MIGSHFAAATGGVRKMLSAFCLGALSNRLLGAVTILGGEGVVAAICLLTLLVEAVVQLSLGVTLLIKGDVLLLSFSARCIVASWLLLLYATAMCLGLGHE
jgi:hypothetical protein